MFKLYVSSEMEKVLQLKHFLRPFHLNCPGLWESKHKSFATILLANDVIVEWMSPDLPKINKGCMINWTFQTLHLLTWDDFQISNRRFLIQKIKVVLAAIVQVLMAWGLILKFLQVGLWWSLAFWVAYFYAPNKVKRTMCGDQSP